MVRPHTDPLRERPHVLRQFMVFAAMGAVGTALQYAVLFAGVTLASIDPVLASTVGMLLGAVCNYLLNHYVTFRRRGGHGRTAPMFATVAASGLLLNAGVMFALGELAGLHYLLAQLIATGCVLVWNYGANRCWTYH